MKFVKRALCIAAFALAGPASATLLLTDYSGLGTVYQDTVTGGLSNTGGAGFTDVTVAFKANVETALNYIQNAVDIPGYVNTSKVVLADLSGLGLQAGNLFDGQDAMGRVSSNILQMAIGPGFFIDPTPWENSEFDMITGVGPVGGTPGVVTRRFGSNISGLPFWYETDLLSIMLHELLHGMGFTSALGTYNNLRSPNAMITVPSVISGFANAYTADCPDSHCYVEDDNNDASFMNISLFGPATRVLMPDTEVYLLGTILGATHDQLNTTPNPNSSVPEPGTLFLVSVAALGFFATKRRRTTSGGLVPRST